MTTPREEWNQAVYYDRQAYQDIMTDPVAYAVLNMAERMFSLYEARITELEAGHDQPRGRLSVVFEPRDVWIGLYVARRAVYACLIPCLPLRWERRPATEAGHDQPA